MTIQANNPASRTAASGLLADGCVYRRRPKMAHAVPKRAAWLGVALVPLSLFLSACAGDAPGPVQQTPDQVEAETAILQRHSIQDSMETVATVRPVTEAELAAQIAAQVESVEVEEGQSVRRGQLLVRLDPRRAQAVEREAQAGLQQALEAEKQAQESITAAQAGLEAAQAQAQLAETQFKRFERLLQRKSVSQAEFDQASARFKSSQAEVQRARSGLQAAQAGHTRAQAAIEQARAALRQAEVALGYTRVEAPRAGIITARLAEPGDTAHPGRPLLRLADARSFQALASVSESEVGLAERGRNVPVEIAALELAVEGRVSEIVPESDPANRTFTVKVALPYRPGLRSGLFARVFFPRPPREALLLPLAAVVRRGQLKGTFVVLDDGAIVFRLVETGRSYPPAPGSQGGLEVLSGLQAGQRVIVDPGPQVSEGKRLASRPSRQEPS